MPKHDNGKYSKRTPIPRGEFDPDVDGPELETMRQNGNMSKKDSWQPSQSSKSAGSPINSSSPASWKSSGGKEKIDLSGFRPNKSNGFSEYEKRFLREAKSKAIRNGKSGR